MIPHYPQGTGQRKKRGVLEVTKINGIIGNKRGSSFPLTVALALALVIVLCGISEYLRLMIIAQGVRDAVQSAIISTVNDNYDDVYRLINRPMTRRHRLISRYRTCSRR